MAGRNGQDGESPPKFTLREVRESREFFKGVLRVALSQEDVESLALVAVHLRLMPPDTAERPPV
ncbi:MAG: hypothetical protein NXH97_13525 [Rhodobacteraceae bacterium]|nr:hypothetical protein [Paracoccaceae bacterium]